MLVPIDEGEGAFQRLEGAFEVDLPLLALCLCHASAMTAPAWRVKGGISGRRAATPTAGPTNLPGTRVTRL